MIRQKNLNNISIINTLIFILIYIYIFFYYFLIVIIIGVNE